MSHILPRLCKFMRSHIIPSTTPPDCKVSTSENITKQICSSILRFSLTHSSLPSLPPCQITSAPHFQAFSYFPLPCHPSLCNLEEIERKRAHDVCVLYVARVGVNACLWGSNKDNQVRKGQGWAWVLGVPVSNTFPEVEVCLPGGCVTAGKLCNEQQTGSLPDQIPAQPHIYLAFQKCSAYQWVLLTCQSRQQSASSAL